LNKYKDAVFAILHSAGGILFGQYNINSELEFKAEETTVNVAIIAPVIGTVNANGESLTIEGIGTTFTSTANANDIIVIDTGNTYREQSKYIVEVNSDTSLELESNLSFIGFGRANVGNDTAIITIYDTSIALSSFLAVGDLITVNVANTSNSSNSVIVTKEISIINDVTKRITCNSNFDGVNANSRIYVVSPFYEEVDYKIIPGI
jgi:mannose/fructose/N-acetylgalactosamine-specific phosphotransferase system component IIB